MADVDSAVQARVDNFAITIRKHLEDRDLQGLRDLLADANHRDLWAEGVMQIFDVLGPFLRGFNVEGEEILVAPKFSSALRSILRHLCQVGSPKEALLAIVGGLEAHEEDGVAYSHLIHPLSRVLSRMNEDNRTRRKKTFVLALNTAFSHLKKLPLPEINNLEEMSELNLIDQETVTTRAVASASSMIEFMSQLAPEMETKWQRLHRNTEKSPAHLENPLTCEDLEVQAFVKQVIALFDLPFSRCHVPLECGKDATQPSADLLRKLNVKDGRKSASSDTPFHLKNLLDILLKFCPDVIKLMTFLRAEVIRVEKKKKAKATSREDDPEDEPEEDDDETNEKPVDLTPIAGGSLVYALFYGEVADLSRRELVSPPLSLHLPSVYSRRHFLLTAAPFLQMMLASSEELLMLKGIQCLEALTISVGNDDFDESTLEDLYFRRLLSAVTEYLLVKCPSKLIRRRAVEWIRNLAPKFSAAARFFYVRGLFYSSHHAGFKGYVLTYLLKPQIEAALREKDLAREKNTSSFDEKCGGEDRTHSFVGPNMKSWYSKIFNMPDGPATDLMQHQDTIMAALNLLRYLLIRDVRNVSGIWDLKASIENEFLIPFRKAIDLSKAHYELELKRVKSGERDSKQPEISVDVEGETSPKLDSQRELDCLKSALTNFDLMDSVLCIVDGLFQGTGEEKLSEGKRPIVEEKKL